MKKNMKKLAALLLMAMLVLGLTACGSKEESNGTVEDTVSEYSEYLSEFLVSLTEMPEEELQGYLAMDAEELQAILDQSGLPISAEAFSDIFNAYLSDVDVYGEFESVTGHELKGDEETATQTTTIKFEEHEAILTLVFDADGVVTTGSMDPVYSLGEILQKAGLNTVIGMGTVFIVLIFISFIIAMLPKMTGLIENTGKKQQAAPAAPAQTVAAAPVVTEAEELVDDLELVAVISAAIAAYTGTSSDGFVVRSIKRSKTNKWKKA